LLGHVGSPVRCLEPERERLDRRPSQIDPKQSSAFPESGPLAKGDTLEHPTVREGVT
jgi:hypothetical protein